MGLFNSEPKAPEQEFIDILDAGFKVIQGYTASIADGQWTIGDANNFVPAFMAMPAAVIGAEGVLELYSEFTDEQLQTIDDFVEQEFPGLPDKRKQALIKETVTEVLGDFQLGVKWGGYLKDRRQSA